jgi:hypothetical protein
LVLGKLAQQLLPLLLSDNEQEAFNSSALSVKQAYQDLISQI